MRLRHSLVERRSGLTMVTKQEVEHEVERLRDIVSQVIAGAEATDLAGVSSVLHQAMASIQSLRPASSTDGDTIAISAEQRQLYFPPRQDRPSGDDLRTADARWQMALARGRRYRDEARAQVGPLLTPSEAAQRLGVSTVTVNKWRRQGKLLGLRFDDHQYLYPTFQFAESPLLGERGVLRHFDDVLAALGERTEWEKALFFLDTSPRLHGKTPVAVLRQQPTPSVLELLRTLAQRAGEMGR